MNREEFEDVWKKVETDYSSGSISSEHTLQCSLYFHLRASNDARRIFVESTIHLNGRQIKPDLMLCDDSKIHSIWELKFVPHGYVRHEGDIGKFKQLSDSIGSKYALEIDPLSGKSTDRDFQLTEQTIFVFAAVSQHDSVALDEGAVKGLLGIGQDTSLPFAHLAGSVNGRKVEFRARYFERE